MGSCYKRAFGNFDIENAPDFAAKFSLDILMRDKQVDMLFALLNKSSDFDILVGDPGWEIEARKEEGQSYKNWPLEAAFRAYLDPEEYWTAYPEVYLTEKTFHTYVRQIMEAYLWFQEIEKTPEVEKILALVQKA